MTTQKLTFTKDEPAMEFLSQLRRRGYKVAPGVALAPGQFRGYIGRDPETMERRWEVHFKPHAPIILNGQEVAA